MHFYKLGKDTSWELSGLLQKGQSKAEALEKNTTVHMQSCSLHRQTIKLFKYKMCLVHALVCTDGLKSSYAVCGGRVLKSLSNRSKVWCCCKCHVSLSVDQQKSDEWFWGLSLCLSKTAVRLPHVMHLYITHIEGSTARIPLIFFFCPKTSSVHITIFFGGQTLKSGDSLTQCCSL